MWLLFFSRSANGLASDLEGVGLGDIRTLVKLMCLVAPHAKTTSSATSKGRRDVSKSDELANLSAAIGALAQNDAASSQLLVQLCTQVSWKTTHNVLPSNCMFLFSCRSCSQLHPASTRL